MTLLEPTTTLTDYALAALALVLGQRLWHVGAEDDQRSVQLWGAAFFALAAGAVLGGTAHGFADLLGPAGQAAIWKLTVWSIGLTAALLLAATAYSELRGGPRRLLLAVAAFQFLAYAIWVMAHDDFIWVIVDYLPAVLVVLGLQLRAAAAGRAGARWLVAGILTTLAGSAVQASGFALHEHFNHNDLYHVIQMVATVLLYQGARRLRDLGSTR